MADDDMAQAQTKLGKAKQDGRVPAGDLFFFSLFVVVAWVSGSL